MLYLQLSACITRENDILRVFFDKILRDYSSHPHGRRAGTIKGNCKNATSATSRLWNGRWSRWLPAPAGDYQSPTPLAWHF